MNCKKGDLAIITDCLNDANYLGMIVTCIEPYWSERRKCHAWKVDMKTGSYKGIADQHLRPIRDQPGEDETLTWAPVPHKEMV